MLRLSFLRNVFLVITALPLGAAWAQQAEVDVHLTPAGSFKIKTSEVKGNVIIKGDQVQPQQIVVLLNNIDTGIGLRTTHTKKDLEVDKYPEAVLVSGTGSGGSGKGVIRIKGIEKEITGTYEVSGQILTAHFDLKLSDFKITGIKYMGVGVDDTVNVTVKVPIQN
jgi:hypothetical protein